MKDNIIPAAVSNIADCLVPAVGTAYLIDGTKTHICCEGGKTFIVDPETGEEETNLIEQQDEISLAILQSIDKATSVGIQATVAKLDEVENG